MPQSDFWPFSRTKPLSDVGNNGESSLLQKQLGDMEGEVKEIQMELAAIKQNRLDLHQRKQHTDSLVDPEEAIKDSVPYTEFRKHEEISRYPEICKLREELIRAKNAADEERFQREKYETKLKDLELKLNTICCAEIVADAKDHRKFSEEEVNVLKVQIRDMKEEMEEMRITVVEKSEQLQEYRLKYLQAQQQVEELKRQIDVIEYDNKHVSDQIQIEIHKMKMQFQEKLQELAPLPDLLKGAQIQLQEAKQMQRLAEDSSAQLSNELLRVKEKLVIAVNNFNQEKADRVQLAEENKILTSKLDERQKEIDNLTKHIDEQRAAIHQLKEKLVQHELSFEMKAADVTQILQEMEELKENSRRAVARYKGRGDNMRRHLQSLISEMERNLIQCRAQYKVCQKERDEVRQHMQTQIHQLQENYEMTEIRLLSLQNQVGALKNRYAVILTDDEDAP